MTDETLLPLLKRGDAAAYNTLYQQYWKLLYEKVYSRIEDEETAKDIVQTIFISIWHNKEKLHIETDLKSFLLGAAKMQVLTYYRSERAKRKLMEGALVRMEVLSESIDQLIPKKIMEEQLDQAIKTLPKNMQQTFLLRCNNLSIRDIAKKLNLAEQTVSNHLYECIQRLRQQLAKQLPNEYLFCMTLILGLLNL